MEEARTQGAIFQATGGAALNDDDFFVAAQRKTIKASIAALTKLKKERIASFDRQSRAWEIIESEKPETEFTSPELKELIAWKLEKVCPSKVSLKADRMALWLELKSKVVPHVSPWSEEEEQQLLDEKAKLDNITIEDTEFGESRELARLQAKSLLASLPLEERRAMLSSLMDEETDPSSTDPSSGSEDDPVTLR